MGVRVGPFSLTPGVESLGFSVQGLHIRFPQEGPVYRFGATPETLNPKP